MFAEARINPSAFRPRFAGVSDVAATSSSVGDVSVAPITESPT